MGEGLLHRVVGEHAWDGRVHSKWSCTRIVMGEHVLENVLAFGEHTREQKTHRRYRMGGQT